MSTIARFFILALVMSAGLSTFGCRAQVRANATIEEPDLVLVEGDVWVVEHYNEPVFYTEGYYWRWSGGVWYRSTVHTGSWVQVSVVPAPIQRIPRPEIYVNYTAQAGAEKRKGPPDHAPAHGVRGDEPGHEAGGPPGHEMGHEPPGHEMGPPPGHEKAGGPPMKEEKGPPMKEEKGPPMKEEKPGKPAMKEEKAGPPAKEEKAATKPAKEDKGPPAKEEKAKPAGKEEKAPAKDDKKGKK